LGKDYQNAFVDMGKKKVFEIDENRNIKKELD